MKHAVVALDDPGQGRFQDLLVAAAQRSFDDGSGDDHACWCAVIVICGSACDAAAAFALRGLLDVDGRRPSPRLNAGKTRKLRELLRSKKTVNLKPKAQRELWEALSGDRLVRWPDWIRYVRCVDRRNAVLHGARLPSGRLPGRADAVEALEVTRSLIAHLDTVIRRDPLTTRSATT